MRRLIIGIIGLVGLSGCVYHSGGSAYTETGAVCDSAGLESQLVSITDQSTQLRGALGVGVSGGGGAIGGSRSENDVERVYQLRDRLNRFDAEVDASYRNMVSSCKAYSRCMEMRRYREGECRSSMAQWDRAQDNFTNLSRELKEIQAQVDTIQYITKSSAPTSKKTYTVNPCDPGGRNCSVGKYQY